MSSVDPSKFLFSTLFGYLLNYNYDDPTNQTSVSVPATSHAAGTATSYTLTVPVARIKDFSHVRLNFSHDSSKWYSFPQGDISLDANFSISSVGSYSGSLLTLTFYVVNQVGTTETNTAFTVTAKALLYVAPT